MPDQPRQFASLADALRMAIVEEISGETYYARIAQAHQGHRARAMELLARIEAVTARAILPLAERHGLAPIDVAAERASGTEQGVAAAAMSWEALTGMMAHDYQPYIDEFAAMDRAVPESDRPLIRLLIDHELAQIEFGRREVAGDPDSHAPLVAFLQAHDPAMGG